MTGRIWRKADLDLEMLYRMMRIRIVEEVIAERYHEQTMRCPVHLSVGQEMPAVVSGMLLDDGDFAVSGHRAHAHYLACGGDLPAMLAEIHGKRTGCSGGKGGSMHLVDRSVGFMGSTAIVGGTIPVGVGLGLSLKLEGSDRVSCIYHGDGAVEEGVWYESVNFAALKQLPVLFFCENNFYSVYSPLAVRQPEDRRIYQMAQSIGLSAEQYTGNDPLELYRLLDGIIGKIRAGAGPYLLEVSTYRWREHCGPNYDNDLGYRTQDEFLAWKEKDPLDVFQQKLIAQNRISEAEIAEYEREIMTETEAAFKFAEESPFPRPQEAFTDLYDQSTATMEGLEDES